MFGRRPETTSIVAVAITPFLYSWAFPLESVHWLGWVAFVPWFVAIRRCGLGEALLVTSATTLAGVYLVAAWLVESVSTYYDRGIGVAAAMFLAVWLLTVAPSVWLFTAVYRRLARCPAWCVPLVGAATWAACELGRVRFFFQDPFGMLGYTQAGALQTMQIADVVGIYGVSFLVCAVQLAVVELLLAIGTTRIRSAGSGALIVGVLVVLAQGYGALRLQHFVVEGEAMAGHRKTVGLVQANLDFGWQWKQEFYGISLERYLRMTRDLVGASQVDLVIWPESSMTFFPEEEAMFRHSIASVLRPAAVPLLAGGPARDRGGERDVYYNAAFVFDSQGKITGRYDKQQLLPFAEYYPLASVRLVRRQFDGVKEFVPGSKLEILNTPIGRVGVAICNEVMFPELVGERVRAGAEVLVTLANDTWLGSVQFARESLDMARFRAVEYRRFLVRSSTSGPSVVIDPTGAIQLATKEFAADAAVGWLYPRSDQSFYARWGDWFAWLCAGVAILACWGVGRVR